MFSVGIIDSIIIEGDTVWDIPWNASYRSGKSVVPKEKSETLYSGGG